MTQNEELALEVEELNTALQLALCQRDELATDNEQLRAVIADEHGRLSQNLDVEAEVRARIAAELRALILPCPTHDTGAHSKRPPFDIRCVGCQRYAALVGATRIVAGEESPSARAVREMRQEQAAGRDDG